MNCATLLQRTSRLLIKPISEPLTVLRRSHSATIPHLSTANPYQPSQLFPEIAKLRAKYAVNASGKGRTTRPVDYVRLARHFGRTASLYFPLMTVYFGWFFAAEWAFDGKL